MNIEALKIRWFAYGGIVVLLISTILILDYSERKTKADRAIIIRIRAAIQQEFQEEGLISSNVILKLHQKYSIPRVEFKKSKPRKGVIGVLFLEGPNRALIVNRKMEKGFIIIDGEWRDANANDLQVTSPKADVYWLVERE
jgi:hypothetical protein